jgi:NitT/TauT family transport system substrate-binding protein
LSACFICTAAYAGASGTAKLSVAVNDRYIGSALVLIAEKKGFLSDAGLDVELHKYSTGADALNAALTGGADLATVADAPIVLAVMRGKLVAIVATISVSGRDQGIVVRKTGAIGSPKDLKGKRIAATPGTSGHYALDAMLIASRVPPGTTQFVPLSPEQIVAALAEKKIDAASLWEPYLHQAERALGGDAVVFLPQQQFHRTTFNIAGRRELVSAHPAAMESFLRALLKAEQFAARSPAEARAIYAQASRVEPQEVDRLWPKYRLGLGLEQSLLNLLESQARWAVRYGYAQQRSLPNFLEAMYLDAILKIKPEAVSIIR